jgi:hypothetical protein
MARTLARTVVTALVLLLASAPVASLASQRARAGLPRGPAPTGPRLVLDGQSALVDAAHPSFALRVGVEGATTPSGLELALSVYPRLTSRSAFAETLANKETYGPLDRFPPVPLAELPLDASGARTVVLTVGAPGLPAPASSRLPLGTFPLDLGPCGGPCDGVYPLVVALEDHEGRVLDRLTTHLVLATPPPSTRKLEVAWVLGTGAEPGLSPAGSPSLPSPERKALAALAGALAASPPIPLTLAPDPAVLDALAASPHGTGRTALSALAAWAAEPGHQVLDRTYFPLDPAALEAAGRGGDLARALARGGAVIAARLGVRPSPATWLVTGGLDRAALSALEALGARRFVVPDGDLVPLPFRLTPVHPFELDGPGEPPGVLADPGLAADLRASSDPVLAANDLLADLAQIYFDEPNDVHQRGVVLVTPSSMVPPARLVETVARALATSPILSPVTLDQLFSSVPPETDQGVPLVRRLESPADPASGLPLHALGAADARLSAFASAVVGDAPALDGLANLALAAESQGIPRAARRADLEHLEADLSSQLAALRLPANRTVTLTAETGRIPITIVSTAPYPMRVILRVASDKLLFPHGSSQLVLVDRRDNTAYFEVRARATGDFPLHVTLLAPTGRLVLLDARFTVRSTAASVVGIALTLGALAFLLVWWARSLARARRARRRELLAAR